jgi:TPR repeat protein
LPELQRGGGGLASCRRAAEQGDARAQSQLGWFYGSGTGVEQNYAEAVKWYRMAAEQGNRDSHSRRYAD